MTATHDNQPRLVTAKINYFSPPLDGAKPFVKLFDPNPVTGEFDRNWETVAYNVEIEDLRGKENTVNLDVHGFQFGTHATKVQKGFLDEEEIKQVYYSESAEILKSVTGASRVVVYDHSDSLVISFRFTY